MRDIYIRDCLKDIGLMRSHQVNPHFPSRRPPLLSQTMILGEGDMLKLITLYNTNTELVLY